MRATHHQAVSVDLGLTPTIKHHAGERLNFVILIDLSKQEHQLSPVLLHRFAHRAPSSRTLLEHNPDCSSETHKNHASNTLRYVSSSPRLEGAPRAHQLQAVSHTLTKSLHHEAALLCEQSRHPFSCNNRPLSQQQSMSPTISTFLRITGRPLHFFSR